VESALVLWSDAFSAASRIHFAGKCSSLSDAFSTANRSHFAGKCSIPWHGSSAPAGPLAPAQPDVASEARTARMSGGAQSLSRGRRRGCARLTSHRGRAPRTQHWAEILDPEELLSRSGPRPAVWRSKWNRSSSARCRDEMYVKPFCLLMPYYPSNIEDHYAPTSLGLDGPGRRCSRSSEPITPSVDWLRLNASC
jgi:hypothetical protein